MTLLIVLPTFTATSRTPSFSTTIIDHLRGKSFDASLSSTILSRPLIAMSTTFQIVIEGRVYIYSRRELKFEIAIAIAHKVLQGQSKDSTFDALYKGIAEKWLLRGDIVKPFGVRLENLRFVCTFDLDQDLFTYTDVSGHIQLPLARFREPNSNPPERSEFIPVETKIPPQLSLKEFPPPYHKPLISIPKRRLAFSQRIISNFADQWRHVLRSTYADSTFRRLARAIVSIATNDFRIEEVFTEQHISFRDSYVTPLDVPHWEPYGNPVFNIGDTTVVLHQDLQTALKMAKDEAEENSKLLSSGKHPVQRTYLLLSVRHMMVCHVNATVAFLCTAPTVLMDGLSLPSISAITLLLQALSPRQAPPHTPVHNLPVEIQDQI
ncbi:hypothetical protein ONS95_006950 [Cadophora gregata]|uniref:uncharacterized protein n=1 Tax=Cadophora gregata TaxID=51156 RepID=UPI0026DB8030|nr:uncharacterized protein ONS95_006950 [Cadophora gregata]KAK0101800.1 hypothetical protein ONS95_006950 [Cadophora gregata]